MKLKECLLVKNSCYIKNVKMKDNKPTGIVVHSTGAANKNLKRYVQPVPSQSCYDEVIKDLGKNANGNHWNRSSSEMGKSVCVHAFIGLNAAGEVETYKTLPFNVCCWGCGSGKKGSYNYNPQARIQFEICEDNLTDEKYFNAVMKEAQEFCAYLCNEYKMTVKQICSHKEAGAAGYGSNHGDPDHWLKKFGKTMDWFRSEVQKIMLEKYMRNPVVKPIDEKPIAQPIVKPWIPAVGDVVNYKGNVCYNSANGTTAEACKGGKAEITQIYMLGKSKHPYHLKKIAGGGATVYGWVDEGTFEKVK